MPNRRRPETKERLGGQIEQLRGQLEYAVKRDSLVIAPVTRHWPKN